MKILLTNDDGFDATGIRILYKIFSKDNDVTIVAPKYHQSGAGSSLSIRKALYLKEEEKNIYSLTGTPSDCVKFALKGMKLDVDLVISGCNDGLNIGHDVNYSGTLGAAREAMFCEKKVIAFSTYPAKFDYIEEQVPLVMAYLNKNNLISNKYILNVNLPGTKTDVIKQSFIYDIKHNDIYTKLEDGGYSLDGDFDMNAIEGSDIDHIEKGYISISKLVPIRSID